MATKLLADNILQRANMAVLNKAGTNWVTWAERNITDAEAKIDLKNIRTLDVNYINATSSIVGVGFYSNLAAPGIGYELFNNSPNTIVKISSNALQDGVIEVADGSGAINISLNGTDGSITSEKFVKNGGTSNQFLMANGTVRKTGYSGVTLASGATYTATLTDEIILANAGTTTNIYLPDVTTCTGKVYEIAFYNVATASVSISINANGTQTFDTYPSQTYLNHSYTFGVGIMNTKIVSTGSKWAVLQASIGGF